MISFFGNLALVISLALALVLSIFPIVGYFLNNEWKSLARPLTLLIFITIAIAYVLLTAAFLNDEFSILYVASNSNTQLPLIYKFTAVWGGHEGSMLLWVLFLSVWSVALAMISLRHDPITVSLSLSVIGFVLLGIIGFIFFTSNPFDLSPRIITEGNDLNPLLQDPGMAIHPPMLYLGYVGLAIPFAFSVAILIQGKFQQQQLTWLRPWLSLCWAFLTIGITLGSWWAYYELGWGGWWFWDPVENASFMPWLIATALIHSASVTENRGSFKSWFILLSIIGFALSLLGTFLVRSGVLVSVHAFASDPSRGLFILVLIGLILGISLLLFALRARVFTSNQALNLLSKESFLLANNLFLLVASLSILLGTVYPLILDGMGLGKISVGAPYFDLIFLYLMLPLMLLIGLGIHSDWIKSSSSKFRKLIKVTIIAVILPTLIILFLDLDFSIFTLVGYWSFLWILLSTLVWAGQLFFNNKSKAAFRQQLPMIIAHSGLAIFIFGVTCVNNYSQTIEEVVALNSSIEFNEREWFFGDLREVEGPNYLAIEAEVIMTDANGTINFYPQRRIYSNQSSAMTEASIDANLSRDLFVALGDPVNGSSEWGFRFQYRPFIRLIWLGALIMAIGGMISTVMNHRKLRLA
jgi:cytochrome c-type biogenesis protein CcmF